LDAFELATTLQTLLSSRRWDGDANNDNTFRKVLVVPDFRETSAWFDGRMPACLIAFGSAQADRKMPDILTQVVRVRIWQRLESNESGEALILGRNSAATSSIGQGLLRLERELAEVMTVLSQTNGVTINQVYAGATATLITDERTYGYRDFRYEAEISTFPDP